MLGSLYVHVKHVTPHHHSTSLSLRGIAAALLVAASLAGCDAPDDEALDRELALDDEALDDEDIDALAAEELEDADAAPEGEEASAADPAVETIADVIASLPPEAVRIDLLPEDLDRPVEVVADQMAIDVDGNGVIDQLDDLVTVSDPVAIGEMACATTSIASATHGASVAMSTAPNCGYAWDGSVSPNTSYDPVGCPHQYVTEVTGTYNKPLSFYWDWHGGTLDQTTCGMAHANLSAYGAFYNWFTGTTSWTKIGTSSVHGQWVSGPWFSYCSWQYDQGSGPLPSLGNHLYYKVRTAAQATGFVFKQRVEGGVTHGNGPC